MALLAFDLKAKDNVVDLLSPRERQNVAIKVNEAILEANGYEKASKLCSILKLLNWGQKKLEDKVIFPVLKSYANPSSNDLYFSHQI